MKADSLIITPTLRTHSDSQGVEVMLLGFRSTGRPRLQADPKILGAGWKVITDVSVSAQVDLVPYALKGVGGKLALKCGAQTKLIFLSHPWSGIVEITQGKVTREVDLYSPTTTIVVVDMPSGIVTPAEPGIMRRAAILPGPHGMDPGIGLDGEPTEARQRFYERQSEHFDPQEPVVLYVPRWHGVAASSRTLFRQSLPVPETLDGHPDTITRKDIAEYARALVATGCRHFVISGGDLFNLRIIKTAMQLAPDIRFDLLWHSNFLQMGERHDWDLLRHWLVALNDGLVTRVAVVKEGLEQWFQGMGLEAIFLPNVVPFDTRAVQPTTVQDKVGIWLSGSSPYRKLPHASLMALHMVPEVTLQGSGFDPESLKMVSDLGLRFQKITATALPQAQMHTQMRQTGLSLYVTTSECSPMVPLESFALGVPCLVGPSSHLFRRSEVLSRALIVQHPHSPAEIAEKIRGALANQDGLFKAYLEYYEEEKKLAEEGVARLTA